MNTSNGLETLGFLYVSPPASARRWAEQAPAILKSTAKEFFFLPELCILGVLVKV